MAEKYSDLYENLVKFKNNEISVSEVNDNNDELIHKILPNGLVEIVFEEASDYVNLFPYEEGDKYSINIVFSHYYYKPSLIDDYHINDEWYYGGIFYHFDNDNLEKLSEILKYFSTNLDIESENSKRSVAELLEEHFSREADDIKTEFSNLLSNEYSDHIEKTVKNDICNAFRFYNIWEETCMVTYHTTVDDLITLYNEHGNDDYEQSLSHLLKQLAEESVSVGGDFYQDLYSISIDNDNFNKTVSSALDDMREKLEDKIEFVDIEEFKKIYKVLSDYQFNFYYKLPKDKRIEFMIKSVNPETNLISIQLKSNDDTMNGDITLENFNLLLHHPELFSLFE